MFWEYQLIVLVYLRHDKHDLHDYFNFFQKNQKFMVTILKPLLLLIEALIKLDLYAK